MPMDNEKDQQQPTTDQQQEQRGQAPVPSRWRTLVAKKWFSPVLYLLAAAIIFTVMWQIQNRNQAPLTQEELGINVKNEEATDVTAVGEDAVAVTTPEEEEMMLPIPAELEAQLVRTYFDDTADASANSQAVVQYQDSFMSHKGWDWVLESGESFPVLAALSGEVIRVEQDPLVGTLVEIRHQGGLSTIYQSLAESKVQPGDKVNRGDTIGTAGSNELESDLGVHLHFEVWKDGRMVSPARYLDQDDKKEEGTTENRGNTGSQGETDQNRQQDTQDEQNQRSDSDSSRGASDPSGKQGDRKTN